jgi:hypothetical protein
MRAKAEYREADGSNGTARAEYRVERLAFSYYFSYAD